MPPVVGRDFAVTCLVPHQPGQHAPFEAVGRARSAVPSCRPERLGKIKGEMDRDEGVEDKCEQGETCGPYPALLLARSHSETPPTSAFYDSGRGGSGQRFRGGPVARISFNVLGIGGTAAL